MDGRVFSSSILLWGCMPVLWTCYCIYKQVWELILIEAYFLNTFCNASSLFCGCLLVKAKGSSYTVETFKQCKLQVILEYEKIALETKL